MKGLGLQSQTKETEADQNNTSLGELERTLVILTYSRF